MVTDPTYSIIRVAAVAVALGPGVLFVDANHEVPCQYLWVLGCDPDNGQYLTALNPATGALYWRYRSDQIAGYLLSAGA
jgi:hypothetical protein